ncbi:hypothetical protein P692DRAFT_20875455 [Suillus brevipes Sb2]|nr:hypothetical protein P692DRAFT_20875455 [Suillus brevipes Sb2]
MIPTFFGSCTGFCAISNVFLFRATALLSVGLLSVALLSIALLSASNSIRTIVVLHRLKSQHAQSDFTTIHLPHTIPAHTFPSDYISAAGSLPFVLALRWDRPERVVAPDLIFSISGSLDGQTVLADAIAHSALMRHLRIIYTHTTSPCSHSDAIAVRIYPMLDLQ